MSLFGRIAVEKNLVSEDQLSRALRLQEETRALGLEKPVGEILVSEGTLGQEDVELILRLQVLNQRAQAARRYSKIALRNKLISDAQRREALAVCAKEGYQRSAADVLVELEALSPPQARAIERALNRSESQRLKPFDRSASGRIAQALEVEAEVLSRARRDDVVLAAVAVREGLLLVPELERALEEQAAHDEPRPRLVQVLLTRGILNEEEVEHVERAIEGSRNERLQIPGYTVLDLLGSGTTSLVLRGRHELIKREVAIKLFRTEHMEATAAEQLIAEAQTIARLRHPNVVVLHEVGRVHRRIYYVMELVDGPTLLQVIQRYGTVPERDALRIGRDVALALGAISDAGMVHRDVKPQNVLLTPTGEAKLTDLGLAMEVHQAPLEETGSIVGTPVTMSPEQANGRPLDVRSDLYSLGATLYYALCGKPPYPGNSAVEMMLGHLTKEIPDVRDANPEIHPRTADLVRRLLAKTPEERPQTASEVAAVLDRIADDLGSSSDILPLR
ncbi:MAG: protein kinase [Planctomycetes bacterium]|nr:protein kinase [Planctomycetota bacterium]